MKNPLASPATPKPPQAPTASRGRRIPRQFQGTVLNVLGSETSGYGYEASCKAYGLWTVRALKEVEFFGQTFQPGDLVKLPGNEATFAALNGSVEFVDERLAAEDALVVEAARLRVPLPASRNPAFVGR